ncbi:hypothetical protein BOX15_Mlig011250g2 [Macrostomum lignano]|uniref:Major facilitator superfamily (MFS) profile domain-containing protein n=2 Tax=Macrostomum lignano TaxID=282301 RepID=A0A267GKB2_9PLAT|nr:hypothetical protein BOX15_Mlig011250g2 [Macrostomum lignano]
MSQSAAPDGGWGWMVLLAGHCMHILAGGLDRASGVFYREILKELQQSSASTAGFSALLFASRFMSGPITGVLCKYFGCRRVMMAGGVTSFLGMLLSSFCRSLSLIYLTLGCMTGVGNGLAYTSGLLAVNDYFSRRKATALGLATAGTGVGSFVLPLLTQYLIQVYSFRGCMLILSGLSLNLVVCGALLYPLPAGKKSANGALEAEAADATSEALIDTAGQSETAENKNSKDSTGEKVLGQSMTTIKSRTSLERSGRGFCMELWANFDLKLFLNPYFCLLAAATLFISSGFKSVAVILPHHAQLRGLDDMTSVLLISISGACDTVSRFSVGLFFDIPHLVPHRRRIWTLGMLLTASSITAFAFMQNLIPFILISGAFGLTSGLFMSQLYCMLIDLIGRERSRSGIGLLILCFGFGVAVGPPTAGALKDVTDTYQLSFCVLGASTFVGFVCLCALDVALMTQRRQRRRLNLNPTLDISVDQK